MQREKLDIRETLRFAGAYVAWVIGSGFATGQELLQFFTSFGKKSFLALLVYFVLSYIVGRTLMLRGYEHRAKTSFSHYVYYCGEKVGAAYAKVMLLILVLTMAVLISAAGATIRQYYGIDSILGAAILGLAVLFAYLAGFDRLISVVSLTGPFIIGFSLFVGFWSAGRDMAALKTLSDAVNPLASSQAAPHWLLSGLLYLSLNYVGGSTYYTALGMTAKKRSSVTAGSLLGAVALALVILVINASILFNRDVMASVSVPTLYLARMIHPVFGAVFAVVLVLGIFSSCSATLWSICGGLFRDDKKKNRLLAIGVSLGCLLMGFVPFEGLMAVVYPLLGYIGIAFIACVLYRTFRPRKAELPDAAPGDEAPEKADPEGL